MIQIRPAVAADASRIASIYNDAILNGTATFDTEEKSESDRIQWLSEHVADNLPVLVSLQDGVVTGFAALNKWSPRKAYDTTAEVSLYMDAAYRGSGTGKLLFEQIVLSAQSVGLHCLVGRITQGNSVSIALSRTARVFTHRNHARGWKKVR